MPQFVPNDVRNVRKLCKRPGVMPNGLDTYLSEDSTLQHIYLGDAQMTSPLTHVPATTGCTFCDIFPLAYSGSNMGSGTYVLCDKPQIVKGEFYGHIGRLAYSFCRLGMIMQYSMAASEDGHQHLDDFGVGNQSEFRG
ncbi:hypothetical protein C8R48DRAFT_676321 [Suillus tomentosus]|nr:hypothetical protein C8R48DRAFT_676321 [Suillus tomentosus]